MGAASKGMRPAAIRGKAILLLALSVTLVYISFVDFLCLFPLSDTKR